MLMRTAFLSGPAAPITGDEEARTNASGKETAAAARPAAFRKLRLSHSLIILHPGELWILDSAIRNRSNPHSRSAIQNRTSKIWQAHFGRTIRHYELGRQSRRNNDVR